MNNKEFFKNEENIRYIKTVSKNMYINSVLVYYMELEDYTQELAEAHVIGSIERRDGKQTLIGGKFSLENLYNTVFGVIDEEFLDEGILLNKAE